MAGTSLNDLLYDFLKKITSATSGSTEDMAILALLNAIDPTLVINASDITFTPTGTISSGTVQNAIAELASEKMQATGGTLTNIYESIHYEELTANKVVSFSSGDVVYYYVNPAGASIQLGMPADPGVISKSGIIWVKNNTGKTHTWNTSPSIRFIGEADADTVPTPAADGYWTRYTAQWNDNNNGTGFWAVTLAGKDTA